MTIIIVGAGIGGLTTALQCHRRGIPCEIYEQAEDLRELGVGINLRPHAVAEIAELGLLDELDNTGTAPREIIFATRRGQEITREPCGLAAGFTFPQYSIHRGRLQSLLARAVQDRLGSHSIHFNHRLNIIEENNDGIVAHFINRRYTPVAAARGAALIGADGIHSTVRAHLFPDEGAPRWNGVMMWRGAANWAPYETGRSILFAGPTAAKLVAYPITPALAGGSVLTNWAICMQTGRAGAPPPQRQDWARRADRAIIRRLLDQFTIPHLDLGALVAATADVWEFPMCDRDPLDHWGHGLITLLGDAAHPMYPMGSNGSAQAILDATSIARHLADAPTTREALRRYQQERLPATSQVVLLNRVGGPERLIDEVERLAPDGFADIDTVLSPEQRRAILTGYKQVSGESGVQRH